MSVNHSGYVYMNMYIVICHQYYIFLGLASVIVSYTAYPSVLRRYYGYSGGAVL